MVVEDPAVVVAVEMEVVSLAVVDRGGGVRCRSVSKRS